jgi:putative spermidine/putrescine transport system permease protein
MTGPHVTAGPHVTGRLILRRRKRWDGTAIVLGIYMALFIVFIAAPIVAVVLVSFSTASFIVFPIPGYGMRWYWRIIEYRPFIDAMIVSAELAVASATLAALLGVPAALLLARSRGAMAAMLANLLLAPVSVPAIVLGFALLYFLSALGLGISFASLLIAHTVAAIPYLVRTVLATYRAVPAQYEEAASILGASRWQVLRHTTLPLVRPGIFAGAMFAVLTSLDNLPLSFFFGGANTNTLPVVMLSYMENQFDPSIAAVSTVQMLGAIAALLVLDRVYGIQRLTVA